MSGIAGICNLDGAPADPVVLQAMMQAIAHRGPDASGSWIDGPVALGHLMLQATPESLRETQPFANPAAGLCVTFDGRVDNGVQLRATLDARGYVSRTGTDAELLLQAYECWGEGCAREILGDFAFAIWDVKNHNLFCARDQLGIKPFYYVVDRRRFIFGSELQQLFAGSGIVREPNEGMIGEYLANAITSRDETLYRGVLRLPPAHCLSVRQGKVALRRYWDIDPARAIRYRTDAEYAEHFMEIFKQSVQCRLRSHRPVSMDLSGGLDSSSIVSVVQILKRNGEIPATDTEACSLVFPGMACDESGYIDDVVRKSGIKSTLLAPYEPAVSCHEEYVGLHGDFPGNPGNYMWKSVLARATARGARVHLTGIGGDDWLSGTEPRYLELLRGFRLGELLRRARADADSEGFVTTLRQEIREGIMSALSPAAIRTIRGVLGRRGVPEWINIEFAGRSRLSERLEKKRPPRGFEAPQQRDLHGWLNSGYFPHSLEYDDRSSALAGIEFRHPFHDRRIVELGFAMPREQFWRRGQTKFVLREAMKGILPESVRQRSSKADFSHSVADTFRALGGESLFDTLSSTPMQWVDKGQIRAMCHQMMRLYARGDEHYASLIWPPWTMFGIDLWYKMTFENLSAPLK